MWSKIKKWIGLLLFVALPVTILAGTNYLVDPSNIFHNFSEEMSQAMLDGHKVQVLSNNLDEREVLQHLIEKMPAQTDVILCGSSTALGIDSEMAGTDSYYNFAVSSADYYDLMATMGLLQINGKTAKKMIIPIETRMFDSEMYMKDGRHDRLMDYSRYMIDYLNGEEPDMAELQVRDSMFSKVGQLLSVPYFQHAVSYFQIHGSQVLRGDRWQIVEENAAANIYLPDYSMEYSQAMEQVNEADVIQSCKIYWLGGNITENALANTDNMEVFEKLIVYLQNQGTEVELLICPYAPALWARISEQQFPMIFQLEQYAGQLSEQYGVVVRGSYDPHKLGLSNEDFYDARHVRKSSMEKVYNAVIEKEVTE